MAETVGTFFYFDWEMRLMEWLQANVGSGGFLFQLLSGSRFAGKRFKYETIAPSEGPLLQLCGRSCRAFRSLLG